MQNHSPTILLGRMSFGPLIHRPRSNSWRMVDERRRRNGYQAKSAANEFHIHGMPREASINSRLPFEELGLNIGTLSVKSMGAISYHHAIMSLLSLQQLLFVLAALLPIIFLLLLLCNKGSCSTKTCVPPSPSKLPIIGNLHQLGTLPHRSLQAMAEKLGPIMLLQLGQVPALVVSSMDMAREIMKNQDHIFASRPSLKAPKTLLYEGRDVAFAPYGEYWRQARKMCVFHLLSPKMVQSYKLIREEEVAFMIEVISRSCSSGTVMNMSEVLNSLAKNIISRTALGNCPREEEWYNIIHVVIHECSKMMGAFHVGDYFPSLSWLSRLTGLDARVNKAFEKVDEILDVIVDGHINRSSHDKHKTDNFVDILLSLEKESNKYISFGKENIKAIVEDLFGAGTESMFVVMDWILADLIRNPEARKRLKGEIRGIVGSKPMVKEEDLNEMSYLKAVIKESMRLHPPGPFLVPRELIEDTKIAGYDIPRRARIFVNVWAIQRDPKIWEAPEEFRPERFLGSSVDFKGHDFQLIPFGAGRRICPGIGFAVPIIELAIANLMHRFDWKLPAGMKEEDMDMAEAFGLTMRKKSALQLVAAPCLC